jgi:ribosomal protein S27E
MRRALRAEASARSLRRVEAVQLRLGDPGYSARSGMASPIALWSRSLHEAILLGQAAFSAVWRSATLERGEESQLPIVRCPRCQARTVVLARRVASATCRKCGGPIARQETAASEAVVREHLYGDGRAHPRKGGERPE